MFERLRRWADAANRDAAAVHLAARDPRLPWPAKTVASCVAGYALSPIHLIPDFIPLLGRVETLIVIPAGVVLAVRLIPPSLMAEHRKAAATMTRPQNFAAAAAILAIWTALTVGASFLAYRTLDR